MAAGFWIWVAIWISQTFDCRSPLKKWNQWGYYCLRSFWTCYPSTCPKQLKYFYCQSNSQILTLLNIKLPPSIILIRLKHFCGGIIKWWFCRYCHLKLIFDCKKHWQKIDFSLLCINVSKTNFSSDQYYSSITIISRFSDFFQHNIQGYQYRLRHHILQMG